MSYLSYSRTAIRHSASLFSLNVNVVCGLNAEKGDAGGLSSDNLLLFQNKCNNKQRGGKIKGKGREGKRF